MYGTRGTIFLFVPVCLVYVLLCIYFLAPWFSDDSLSSKIEYLNMDRSFEYPNNVTSHPIGEIYSYIYKKIKPVIGIEPNLFNP